MLVTLLLLCAAWAVEPTPAADAELERAKILYTNGAQLYEEGLYDKAILAFQEAYAITKNAKLLYNVANAQERSGDIAGSLDTLNTYRVYAEESERDTLDRRIRGLETRLDADKEKEALAAAAAAAAAAPAPAPVPAPVVVAPVIEPEPRSNVARWVLVGTGVGLAGGFGAVAGVSYGSGLDARDAGNESSYQSSRTLNNVSIPLAGVGGALLLTGLLLPSRTLSAGPGSVAFHTHF